jgi:hypoxanthine-DNA glycosylase
MEPVDVERLTGFAPVWNPQTKVLILGSFPSVASLQASQYYAHPRNAFWPLMQRLLGVPLVERSYPQRIDAVLNAGIGIWDVYHSCRRSGSLDASIVDAEPNDFVALTKRLPRFTGIGFNGGEAQKAMRRAAAFPGGRWRLPSTSPAHASLSFAEKCERWREALLQGGIEVSDA